MKKIFLVVILMIIMGSNYYAYSQQEEDEYAILYKGLIGKHKKIGAYEIHLYTPPMQGMPKIIIERNGEIIYVQNIWDNNCGVFFECENDKFKREPGTDINGDGYGEVVVGTWCGAGYYGKGFYIFSLRGLSVEVYKVENPYNEYEGFKDIDGDGVYEFITYDVSYECFGGVSRAASPYPKIVLKFEDEKYCLAPEFMIEPPPSSEEENKIIEKIRSDPCWHENFDYQDDVGKFMKEARGILTSMFGSKVFANVPPDVAIHVFDLIYKGHPQLAWKFIEKVWPEDLPGMKEYISEIIKALNKSIYWPSLRQYFEKVGIDWRYKQK